MRKKNSGQLAGQLFASYPEQGSAASDRLNPATVVLSQRQHKKCDFWYLALPRLAGCHSAVISY